MEFFLLGCEPKIRSKFLKNDIFSIDFLIIKKQKLKIKLNIENKMFQKKIQFNQMNKKGKINLKRETKS